VSFAWPGEATSSKWTGPGSGFDPVVAGRPVLEVRALGPVEAEAAHQQVALRGRLEKALLARLALTPGRAVPVERLVDDLWGERAGNDPAAALQTLVHRLRRSLGPARAALCRRDSGYTLMVPPEAVDVCLFEDLVARARSSSPGGAEARALLHQALGLWRGTPFSGLEAVPFVEAQSARLEASRLTALEDRLDADLEAGAHGAVVAEMEGLVAEHPFRERIWAQLMTALYRSGSQTAAVRAFARLRASLAEVGLEPSLRLRDLEHAVLRQDPALDWRCPSGPEMAALRPLKPAPWYKTGSPRWSGSSLSPKAPARPCSRPEHGPNCQRPSWPAHGGRVPGTPSCWAK
jgi:DNA-binding SARP family transcriptional activator